MHIWSADLQQDCEEDTMEKKASSTNDVGKGGYLHAKE